MQGLGKLVIVVVTGVLGAIAARNASKWWAEKQKRLKGKRIAVLGERGVGKTHLWQLLTTGEIPQKLTPTVAAGIDSGKTLRVMELSLDVADCIDISGDKESYLFWRELVLGSEAAERLGPVVLPRSGGKPPVRPADYVLYLLRADRVMQGDTSKNARIIRDAEHLGGWVRSCKSPPRVLVVGTFGDQDPAFGRADDVARLAYVERFRRSDPVDRLIVECGGKGSVHVLVGSLVDRVEKGVLAYRILEAMGATS